MNPCGDRTGYAEQKSLFFHKGRKRIPKKHVVKEFGKRLPPVSRGDR
jgi:hypothetical protein